MEINKNISAPIQGMNRDSNLDRLQDGEFTFVLNSDSNGRVRTNEPSNYLYTIFPEGYRVISHPLKDKLKNRTYYWLTNPDTGFSSFGYVIDRKTYHDNTDLETNCSECDSKNQLSTPLENTAQTPEFEYNELFHDRCLPKGEGLNLDINFPIKSPVLKSEISGTVVYWEDDKNPPRYAKVDDVSYLYQQDIPCEDPQETPCLQVRKLLQFPNSEPLHLEAISQNVGGNLRRGSYEVFACYSDALGSEMSEYSSSSNVIKIFDINNNVLEPQNLDDYTNYAIKIRINNLDYKNFQYYKIVVVERGVTDSNPVAFEEGIFPTSTEDVVITSSGRVYNTPNNRVTNLQTKKVVDLNTIFLRKPKIERAKGEAIIGDRKYIHGVKRKEQLNIQPVVNLLSSLAQWQTVCTTEQVYEDGVLSSKYGTYPRTETQAFGIRFLQKDGGKSEVFPMVGRPSITSDLEEVSEEVKIKSSCGDTERDKRWQYFDTATKTEQLFSNIEGVEVSQIEIKSCLINGVYTIPQNNIIIPIEQDFTNLQDYLEENPDANIPEITPYLNNTYPSSHCYPPFGIVRTSGELVVGKKYIIHQVNAGDNFSNTGFTHLHEPFIATATHPNSWVSGTEVEETTCGEAVLQEESVSIVTVVNEEVEKEEALFPNEYSPLTSSGCNIYEIGDNGKPQRDELFEYVYDSTGSVLDVVIKGKIFKRIYNFSNESCPLAEQIPIISGVNSQYQKYWFRLMGANTVDELHTTKISNAYPTGTVIPSGFTPAINKTALWFKGVVQGYEKFLFEISATQNPSDRDNASGKSGINQYQEVRVSLFNRCSDQEAKFSKIIRATNGLQWMIQRTDTGVILEDKDNPGTLYNITIDNPFPGDSFYVAIDPPTVKRKGAKEDDESEDGYVYDEGVVDRWRTAPPLGCFGVIIRPVEYVRAKVSWDAIILDKVETYVSSCSYVVPEIGDCEAIPFERGDFGYTESTRTYPDNKDLYDGSFLKIRPEHLNFNPFNLRTKFENYFVTGYDDEGNYILNPELTDLRCKPIRHFKFPSNTTSPFIYNLNLPKGSTNFIFPIGINIDVNVVRSMLVVARENGLITQEQYDNITGFEILRGDDTYSRSVVGSGLLFDMYEYEKDNDKILYSNFPHNDLGDDLFHYQEKTNSLIPHPYNALKNNRFSFISPDLLHTGTTLPSEMYVQGFLRGHSSLRFTEMEDHARWTILGRRARRTATTLAIAESALETAIAIGTATGNQWFMGGLTFGASLGLVGVGIITAANVLSGFTKIGEYRYQWLETFRNLGASRNFAYYGNGLGRYSTFLKNDNEENQVFSLSVSKYLPQGHFDVLDTGTKETYKVNNYLRERSVFLSTGDSFLEYPIDYRQIDNNKLNSSASKNINSRIGCSSNTYSSNIASPYITLRNYVPDQWGEIGSVRWLTTGKQYKFGVDNTLDATFGGSSYITTFNYWRKVPFFTQTAFNYPDKTAFEYSSKYNIGRTRFYCDYETDTEYNDLLIPFPDIDSDYRLDCLDSSNKFYVNSGKLYTSFRNVISFPVETRMNLNWRYGGKEKKEQFYPIQSDIEDATQEKIISIKEQEQILYANTYSLPNTYSGAVSLPFSYDREFYKKISENQNEVIWSEADLNETNRIQDPYLVYKPLNTFLFETENGLLKSLKEATANTAVARFTHGMQVFNTVDTLAEKITPQTQSLGTGGIFATSRPISFNNSSLGFTGTQHYNVLETEFGDIHIDSERGQILFLNNQGNQLEDLSYSYQGTASNMNKWFKKHLPFKIKRYFPDLDTDNPFKDLGISGGYDAVNKRAFITKLDYIPKNNCIQYYSKKGFMLNETLCNGVPKIPTCPEGYTYNSETDTCERVVQTSPCPIGYYYENGVCVADEVPSICKADIVFVVDRSLSVSVTEMAQQKTFLINIIDQLVEGINSGDIRVGITSFATDATVEGNLSSDYNTIVNSINSLPVNGSGNTNTVEGLCVARGVINGINSREDASKTMILVTDGVQNANFYCTDAVNYFPDNVGNPSKALEYAHKLKNEGIYITLAILGDTQSQINNVANNYGGALGNIPLSFYPLPSVGDGLYGYATYEATFNNALSIASDIASTVCRNTTNINCNDCNFNEDLVVCECEESIAPTYVDVLTPIEVSDRNYFEDVSWTIAFKFEEKGFNSYHSFHPNFYNPHQDFFQTGYNSNNSKLWSHTLEDNSFQVFQGQRKPFIVETVVTNKNTSKFLNAIAIESEAVRYQDSYNTSQWWDKGFDTLTIYNNTDNSGRLKLTPLKNYRDLTKYPINNPDNTQTITFVPQDEKQLVNYFYNRTRREDRNIPQWISDRNEILKSINNKAVKFTGKQLLERLRGNSFIIRLENESESRFKINLKDVIIEETNYQS